MREAMHGRQRLEQARPSMSIQTALIEALHPPCDADGYPKPVMMKHDSAVIMTELLEALRRMNSPWMTTCEVASYLSVDPSMVTYWKNKGDLQPFFAPRMGHPRYKRVDVDAFMQRRKHGKAIIR